MTFDASRLGRVRASLERHVASGLVPGCVAAFSRRAPGGGSPSEAHVEVIGEATVRGAAMAPDTIFRITSMTKPIAAAAALALVEQGLLRLDEPVDRLIPELANRRVLKSLDAELDDTVPAARSITLRDLLDFKLGFGMVFPFDRYPIQKAVKELLVTGLGPPTPMTPHDPDTWIRRFGELPLMAQPGTTWMYNTGSHVLGVLLARAAGRPLEDVLREVIFEPLGMKDTGFVVPAAKRARLATQYVVDQETQQLVVSDACDEASAWARPPAAPDAAAGLVSTVDDYLAFARMLLDGGRIERGRVLSRASVALMTTDQLSAADKGRAVFFPGFFDGHGWGFGVQVVTRRDDLPATPGRYGWDGGYGTYWANDPMEGVVGVLMTQVMGYPAHMPIYVDFWTSVYQALD